MYIFCGLTLAGKTSIRWVSPEAKFILEVNQGLRCTSKGKRIHNIQRRHKSPLKVHCEYFAKMLLYVHAVLSQPCLSFAKEIW